MPYFGPTVNPRGPRPWKGPLYNPDISAGWSARMAEAPQGASTNDVLAMGYSNDMEKARYERARAQSRAAAPTAPLEYQRAISMQGYQNPGYQYRPTESGEGGYWVYVGVGNEKNPNAPVLPEPQGASEAFGKSWQDIGRRDYAGFSRDSEGYALDGNGNRIPGSQTYKPPPVDSGPPTSPTVTRPDGTVVNLPNGTRLANGGYADGKGGVFYSPVGPGTAPAAHAPPPMAPPTPVNPADPNGMKATGAALAGVGAPAKPVSNPAPSITAMDPINAAVQGGKSVIGNPGLRKSPFAAPMNWGI